MIVYKVVSRRSGSYIVDGCSMYYCEYKKGITTFPCDSRLPLLAFETRTQAQLFLHVRQGRILRCRARRTRNQKHLLLKVFVARDYPIHVEDLVNILRSPEYCSRCFDPRVKFPGTVFCDSITPLE